MLVDPYHHQLKADLYATIPDLLICLSADEQYPYRLIFWHGAIDHAEAARRIAAHGARGKSYRVWRNPSTDGNGSVSVIETDDQEAERTIGAGIFASCYRVMTPEQAAAEDATTRSLFPWRIMCRTRSPLPGEVRHILGRDGIIAYHSGYHPDCPRWAPHVEWLGTVYAIHVRDEMTAILLQIAIGDSVIE